MNQAADERAAVAAAIATLLAAVTLSPLVAGSTWLVVTGVAVLGVMITGIAGRAWLRWWPLVALAQLAVLTMTVTLLFARGNALAGVLPGPGAFLRLEELVRTGLEVTRNQPPPVDLEQGVVLMLVAGIGVVAIAVDLLAATLRQPALAGLPLLAVYCVPAALLPGGLPWYYFVLAAGGFLLLLSADAGDRVRTWGRVLTAAGSNRALRRPSADGVNGLARGGRRVGAIVVVVAALVPAVVPGLNDSMLSGGDGLGDGNGDGATIRTINPFLNLRQDLTRGNDATMLRYRTSATEPEPLRIVTADVYDGKTWAPRQVSIPRDQQVQNGLPGPPGLENDVAAEPIRSSIDIGTLRQSYLPLPYPAQSVDVRGRWLYDQTTFNVVGEGVNTEGLEYDVTSLDVRPSPEQLMDADTPPSVMDEWDDLPANLPAEIRAAAQDIAGTGSDYEQAVRLQRYFRSTGGFQYSLDAPRSENGDGSQDAILTFLQVKRGYCVHFASAMAVMARTLGIPARVGVGFLPGEPDADGWRDLTARDAHAWPELYFQGVGWVRFEPTPGQRTSTPPEWSNPPSGTLPEEVAPSAAVPEQSSAPQSSQDAAEIPREEEQAAGASPSAADRFSALPWRPILALAAVVLLALSPLFAARIARRARWRRAASSPAARIEAAWEELRLRLGDLGVGWATSWTPRALQRRLITDLDLDTAEQVALARLVGALEAARYAPPGEAPDLTREALTADVRSIVAAAAALADRRDRWRARLLPSSGVRAIRDAGRRADESTSTAARRLAETLTPHR